MFLPLSLRMQCKPMACCNVCAGEGCIGILAEDGRDALWDDLVGILRATRVLCRPSARSGAAMQEGTGEAAFQHTAFPSAAHTECIFVFPLSTGLSVCMLPSKGVHSSHDCNESKLTSFAKLLSQLPGWFNDCFGGALPTHDALAEVGKQVGCTLLWCHNATATFAWTSGFQLVSFSHLHLAEQETDLGLGHSVSCSTFPRWRIHCAVIEHREVLYCSWLRRLMGLALFTRAPCPRRCPICKGRQARHPVARLPAQGVGK